MVTLEGDELENNTLLLARDVLRNNMTDHHDPARPNTQWIVKSALKDEDIDLPMIILDQANIEEATVTFTGQIPERIVVGLMVWARNSTRRDKIAQEAKAVLRDEHSADSEGTTMLASGLRYLRSTSRNSDGYIQGYSELLRIKEMDITYQYMR